MCKIFTRYLIFLFCSAVGCIICTTIYAPGIRIAQADALKSLETPTAVATNAAITITQPGGNGGTIGGHPGTRVQIVGNGFQPGSSINIYTTSDTTQCSVNNADNLQAFTPRTVKANGNGNFQINPQWPASSGQQGTTYYICAINAATGTATVSGTAFTVAQDVTVTSTTPGANPGDQVTITGKNWLPAQQLAVSITSNQGTNSIVSGQTNSNSDGSFSIDLTIPQGVQGGSYGVSVVAVNEQSLNTYKDNVITINASAQTTPTVTATPSPAATPTETATATPAPTPTAVAGGGGTGTTGGGSGIPPLTLLIFTLGALGTILVIVGLIMFVSYSKAS